MTPETKERGAAVKPVGPNQAHYACVHAVHLSYTHTFTHPAQYHLFTLLKGTLVALVQICLGLNVGFVLFIKELSRLVENQA